METYRDLYTKLYSYDNLKLAWIRARKRKTLKEYVIEFESNFDRNLKQLKHELGTFTYSPAPLTTFIVKDPKTRKISASHFRDRVIHHAICNMIAPIFEKDFIYDSFSNQKRKGTHAAIKRLEKFMRKVGSSRKAMCGQSKLFVNKMNAGYVLKADVRHYFDTVDHQILLRIVERKINDSNIVWLIKRVLENYKGQNIGKGMPLGNLTSQFFANVYLNELDHFVKHTLKAKYYIRYVDDFVILHKDRKMLEKWKDEIDTFLRSNLKIELHPEKSKIIPLGGGVAFLGFRIFHHHRLLKKSNTRRIWKRIERFKQKYDAKEIDMEKINQSLEGWIAYAEFANTYNLRTRVLAKCYALFSLNPISALSNRGSSGLLRRSAEPFPMPLRGLRTSIPRRAS